MRGKLAVLVALPLVVVVALAVIVAYGRADRARSASTVARQVMIGSQVGALVADLQQERLVSVGYLQGAAPTSALSSQVARVIDDLAELRRNLGDDINPAMKAALDNVEALSGRPDKTVTATSIRDGVVARIAHLDEVLDAYTSRINGMLDALTLIDGVDVSTVAGREVIALDSLLRIDELRNSGAALLVAAAGGTNQSTIVAYAATQSSIVQLTSRFTRYATPAEVQLFGFVGDAYTARTGPDFARQFATRPTEAVKGTLVAVLYPELTSFVLLGRFVETKIAADVTASVNAEHQTDVITAYAAGGVALIVLLAVAMLAITVARSIVDSISSLTRSADRVASLTEEELRRVADDDVESPQPARLEPLDVGADSEFADLNAAFERVQGTAGALVARQAVGRRNVAQMFGHIGRRTQNLVSRQLAIIDALEFDETDPQRLAELYRLDHVTSRLRRNAGALVVMSGATDAGSYFAPLPVSDIVRLALAEIEDYTRVDIDVPTTMTASPAIINDLVLILAELMENATAYSPPHTRVTVTADTGSTVLYVVDEGIGMRAARLDEENARLTGRERLDLAPTEVLGLFVVGRLARRHGIDVRLGETAGGGVTVALELGRFATHERRPDSTLAPRVLGRAPVVTGPVMEPAQAMAMAAARYGWSEPMALDSKPYNVETLDRATKVLEAAAPWNAFEVPVDLSLPAAPTAPMPMPAATPEPPQALVPDPTPAPTPDLVPDLVPEPAPAAAPEVDPVIAALTQPLPPLPEAGPLIPEYSYPDLGRQVVEPPSWLDDEGAATVTLTRRIPGATTTRDDQPVLSFTQHRPLDPREARDLVEQFELGVAQALAESPQGEQRHGDVAPHREEDTL
jgi:signal transduction histidine kinase